MMASCREIITLQIGNYSNYVGSHFWNNQESSFVYSEDQASEICHDVLYREGQNFKGELTYTPRLLLLDLKGSLKSLSRVGDLYSEDAENQLKAQFWDESKIETKEEAVLPKHEFLQDLEKMDLGAAIDVNTKDYNFSDTVEGWTDYLKARYHPRTVNIVEDYNHKNATKPFDIFSVGSSVFSLSFEDEYCDKLRCYIEESDNLQGFQVISDAQDGFGGLASSILKHIEDEYSSKTRLTFPVIAPVYDNQTPLNDVLRMINLALSFQHLSEFSSLCVPLCTKKTAWRGMGEPVDFPNLSYHSSVHYETSSILAAAIDTIGLRYRLKDEIGSISDITNSLCLFGRKIAAGSVSLPFPIAPNSFLLDTLESMNEGLWTGLTPGCQVQDDRLWVQSVSIRGIPQSRLRNPNLNIKFEGSNPAYTCTSVKEMISLFLSFCSYATVSNVTSAQSPLKTVAPFPQIFDPSVSCLGSVDPSCSRADGFKVQSTPVLAGVHSCKSLGDMLQSLYDGVKRVKIKRFHQLFECGMDEEEYNECFEKLLALRECYNEEFDV